jgi:hypothetical protein
VSAPSVGRIVHYTSYGTPRGEFTSECRAAVITEVPDLLSHQPNTGPEGYVEAVCLAVLNPSGMFFDRDVAYSEEYEGGTWHWPERTD